MTTYDWIFLALIAVALLCDALFLWPRFQRQLTSNPARARIQLWTSWLILLWMLTSIGWVLWQTEQRNPALLWWQLPHGTGLWASVGLVALIALYFVMVLLRFVKRTTGKAVRLPVAMQALAPQTTSQLSLFFLLSITAGICEEFIFRGWLIWVLQTWSSLSIAALLSAIVFGLAHAYQGMKGVITTALAGGVLTVIMVFTESIFTAMLVHALLDIGQGLLMWTVVRRAAAPALAP